MRMKVCMSRIRVMKSVNLICMDSPECVCKESTLYERKDLIKFHLESLIHAAARFVKDVKLHVISHSSDAFSRWRDKRESRSYTVTLLELYRKGSSF